MVNSSTLQYGFMPTFSGQPFAKHMTVVIVISTVAAKLKTIPSRFTLIIFCTPNKSISEKINYF